MSTSKVIIFFTAQLFLDYVHLPWSTISAGFYIMMDENGVQLTVQINYLGRASFLQLQLYKDSYMYRKLYSILCGTYEPIVQKGSSW